MKVKTHVKAGTGSKDGSKCGCGGSTNTNTNTAENNVGNVDVGVGLP
jgi:hypothetical protein